MKDEDKKASGFDTDIAEQKEKSPNFQKEYDCTGLSIAADQAGLKFLETLKALQAQYNEDREPDKYWTIQRFKDQVREMIVGFHTVD